MTVTVIAGTIVGPGYKFPNGHIVGASGIPRPTKFANRQRKLTARNANLAARAEKNSTKRR